MSTTTNQAATKQVPSTQPVASNTQPTVPGQPWRTMSTVERDLPTWLKAAMNGKSRNGTFSGRGK